MTFQKKAKTGTEILKDVKDYLNFYPDTTDKELGETFHITPRFMEQIKKSLQIKKSEDSYTS
jgi:hypothetical protein